MHDRSGRRAGPATIRRRRTSVVSIADVGRGTTAPSQAPGRVRRIWSARTPSALLRPDLAGPATRTWSPGRTARPIGPRSASPTPTRTTSSSGGTTSRSSIATWSGSDPTPGAARRGGGHVVDSAGHRILRAGQGRRLEPRVPGRRGGPAQGTSSAHRRRAVRATRARPGRPGGTPTSGRRSTPAPAGMRGEPVHRDRRRHTELRSFGQHTVQLVEQVVAAGLLQLGPQRREAVDQDRAGGVESGCSARCHAVARAPGGAPGRTVRCAPDRRP